MLAFALLLLPLRIVRVQVDPTRVLNRFVPIEALGAGVDGQEENDVDRTFRPASVKAMLDVGLGPLTYRLRTELGCEAWHWNPEGKWSDPTRHQGYWMSSATPTHPILKSFGYRLPRRGNTIDQANDDGYSRLDDGDLDTYWKSNPYLDPSYTGQAESRRAQWVVVDLGENQRVDAVRIHWANPYALRYRLEGWAAEDSENKGEVPDGVLQHLAENRAGHGGIETLNLAPARQLRFLRLELLRSSHTAEPSPSPDPRDRLGFAIREIEVLSGDQSGQRDLVRHQKDKGQTVFYTSSTDSWHRASDVDPKVDQPGFDLVYQSGLTRHAPMLVPVPVLYGVPEDSAAEIRWLHARGYPIKAIEMGEEPDGQCASSEHYADLYAEVASRIRRLDKKVKLGGPCFQTVETDYAAWPADDGRKNWIRGFLDELTRLGHRHDFQFFSFEWYPFDEPFRPAEPQLRAAPTLLAASLRRLRAGGLGSDIPWMATEYGYSAFAGPSETDVQGALFNLDFVGKFLELGGSAAYLYGYEPNSLITEISGWWGNLATWLVDEDGDPKDRLPAYWAAHLLMQHWASGVRKTHRLLRSESSDSNGLTAYALRRPDGKISVLLVNKSISTAKRIDLRIGRNTVRRGTVASWGPAQYRWIEQKEKGRPAVSLPPSVGVLADQVVVPAFSAVVVTTDAKNN